MNKEGRIKTQSSTPLPRGYTFIYPRTKRVRTTSTTSRVYFYVPMNKEDYTTPQNVLHNLAGILLCTRIHEEIITAHMGILLYTRNYEADILLG